MMHQDTTNAISSMDYANVTMGGMDQRVIPFAYDRTIPWDTFLASKAVAKNYASPDGWIHLQIAQEVCARAVTNFSKIVL